MLDIDEFVLGNWNKDMLRKSRKNRMKYTGELKLVRILLLLLWAVLNYVCM